MGSYRHENIVNPPSNIEKTCAMEKLKDSTQVESMMNPELGLKDSYKIGSKKDPKKSNITPLDSIRE